MTLAESGAEHGDGFVASENGRTLKIESEGNIYLYHCLHVVYMLFSEE